MSIPEQAKEVFTGEIFSVYQWEQEMFDGSTEIFEMLKRPNTIQIIPLIGKKIVYLEEEQPNKPLFTSLVGGRQDPGEEPLVTAKRELLEETGLVSEEWELLKTYKPVGKIDWTIYVFVARNCKKVQEQKLDAGERITVKEANFEEFLNVVKGDRFWGNEFKLEVYKDPEGLRKDLFGR